MLSIDAVPVLWYSVSMDKESCLIYEGAFHRVEWYFDESGESQAYDYFLQASDTQKRKFLMLVKKMGDTGVIFNKEKFRNEGNGIFTFKPQPDRYLCFFYTGKKIIVTNAFTKRTDKLPEREKERALNRMNDYIERISKNE